MVKTFKQFKNGKVKKVGKPIFADHERLLTLGVPSAFDARSQWPTCIHSVRNQKTCGSCYAFSAVGMLEDRFCIATQGNINVRLSPEDMVTCDYNNGGCVGGLLSSTINFLITEGVVSDECKPYASGVGVNGFCEFSCADPSVAYEKYACK